MLKAKTPNVTQVRRTPRAVLMSRPRRTPKIQVLALHGRGQGFSQQYYILRRNHSKRKLHIMQRRQIQSLEIVNNRRREYLVHQLQRLCLIRPLLYLLYP